MKWYEYLWFPWTVNKYLWEKLKPEKPQEPGRPPQVSCYGRPLPLVFGKTRVTGNVLFLMPTPMTIDDANRYKGVPTVLALCEGEIAGVGRVWQDKDFKWSPGEWGIGIFNGTRPTQTPWTNQPTAAQIPYPGVAYAATARLLSYGRLAQMSFEVMGRRHATGHAEGDADPALVLADIWTDPAVGAGVPFSVVTGTGLDGTAASSYERYVKAESLWLSPMFSDQRPAAEHGKDVLEASNSSVLWSGGALKVIPLGDATKIGNSVTYTPYLVAQYALGPGDFISDGSERVEVELAPQADVYNVFPVEFLNRSPDAAASDPAHAYNADVVEDPDPVDVADHGERRAGVATMHSICRQDVALKISRIRAQTMVRARNRYRFKLPWRFARLEPMDFVSISEPRLGLSGVVVRIESVEEEDHALSVEAVEVPEGSSYAVAHTVASSDGPTGTVSPWILEQTFHARAAKNWTERTIPAGTYRAVACSPSTVVAVGDSAACATSNDGGATWTAQTIPSGDWLAVTWDGTRFIAVGASGGGPVCATSSDGTTWTGRTIAGSVGYEGIVAYGGLIVAVGMNQCATSPDGTTWTSRTIPSGMWRSVTWTGTAWLAVGGDPGCAATSPDGLTWTAQSIPSGTFGNIYFRWLSVASADNGLVCALGTTTHSGGGGTPPLPGRSAVSRDGGVTWENTAIGMRDRTSPPQEVYGSAVWSGAVFVALDGGGNGSGRVATSGDGVSWDATDLLLPAASYNGSAWTGHCVVAVGANRCATSALV